MVCSTPGFPVHHQFPELAQTYVHQVSDAIQPSHPLSSPFPSAFNVSNESVLRIRWPKYWSFSLSINPSSEYSELISFRKPVDRFDFLAVQVTLKTYRIYRFWLNFLVIYLLKKPDCLSCRVFHSLDFADCISISVSMFLCRLYCL